MSRSNPEEPEPAATKPSVRFHRASRYGIPDLPGLRKAAMRVLRAEGGTGPVDIIFHEPQDQRALNLQWRGLDRTTDVLSFPYEEPDLFGELYIDPFLAAEQAERFRHSLHDEVRRLIVHGCLHLCGYDHMTTPDRKRMRALENRYDPKDPS